MVDKAVLYMRLLSICAVRRFGGGDRFLDFLYICLLKIFHLDFDERFHVEW